MALSSFLNVNGYDFPTPKRGFQYTISTTVDAGRNANNAVVGQIVGRDLYKLDSMEWPGLSAEVWQNMLNAVADYFVPVTFEDCRTGEPITITMYPGDRKGKPYWLHENGYSVKMYENCSFNLIDAGWE